MRTENGILIACLITENGYTTELLSGLAKDIREFVKLNRCPNCSKKSKRRR